MYTRQHKLYGPFSKKKKYGPPFSADLKKEKSIKLEELKKYPMYCICLPMVVMSAHRNVTGVVNFQCSNFKLFFN
jgi:hypothetical protein